MSKKAHEGVDTVIERDQETGDGTITVTEGVETVYEYGQNAPQTEAETVTDEEKARLDKQAVDRILEKLGVMDQNSSPERTQDGKYILGRMLCSDDPFCFYEAEEAETGKAVRLMTLLPHITYSRQRDAWIQTAMKTENRASRCAFDSCIENGQSPAPVLRWLSPEDNAKERRISYLISYQPWGMDFYEWEQRHPSMSEANAVALTVELLSALEGLHSGRYSYYMGQRDRQDHVSPPFSYRRCLR